MLGVCLSIQGFNKSRKEKTAVESAVDQEVLEASPTAAASSIRTPEHLVPPSVSSTQPLWLPQSNAANDLSSFAPKIVVVGVGGAGGNAGAWLVLFCVMRNGWRLH